MSHVLRISSCGIVSHSYPLSSTRSLMSGSKSKMTPPPNRLLAYQPVVSPIAKPGPVRLNTKGTAPSGRNVGILAVVLKMPLDTFCEIVSYLHPSDILQLARTSLKIRAVLMSRNSAHVWITARRTLGLPECPPDLSEPQYASLVFGHNCFACGIGRAMKHSNPLKVRFCRECWNENIVTNRELEPPLKQNKWTKGFSFDLLPSSNDTYMIGSRFSKCSFYKPEYEAVLRRFTQLKKANTPLALSAYMKERKAFVRQSFEFGRDLEAWGRKYSAKLRAEKVKAQEHKDEDKHERKDIVHAKLIKAGYSPADFPFSSPEWDKIATKRVKLTDKYWNSNMLPKLKEMIEEERVRKAEVNRKARLRDRTLEFARLYLSRGVPESEPEEGPFMMPSWGIFEDNQRINAILEEDDYNIPFTEDRYEQIEDVIAEGVIKYNIRARRDLARLHGLFLLPVENEEEADENIIKPFLARATTVFRLDCPIAPRCFSYQTLSEIFHLATVYRDPEAGAPPKWNAAVSGVTPDILAGRITRELLRVAGAPEDSTWEQMESICGERLVCTCRKPGFKQPVCIDTLIKHIRCERTWSTLPEEARWKDEGLEDESNFPVDHAVSEIHNFVKVLPEGVTFDAFMRGQSPPLGGTVGNPAGIPTFFALLVQLLGLSPRVEGPGLVCNHCKHSMPMEYLVWHMNAKHKKVAHPGDVYNRPFPSEILDFDSDEDDSDDMDTDSEIDDFVDSLFY